MPRYIDADRLLKELSFYADRPTKRAMDCVKGYALISDPDVLKVVRCKDCKWWDITSPMATVIPVPCRCTLRREDFAMTENDYCSYGERREKEDEKTVSKS